MAQNAHPEQTIRSAIEFSGVGLHSGAAVSCAWCRPPPALGLSSGGWTWTASDSSDRAQRRQGELCHQPDARPVLISTTEHLLSALIGFGVDNVIVEVDNLELPILDGSALPYVEAFQSVGLKQQRRRREYMRILKRGRGARRRQVHRRLSRHGLRHRLHHRLSRAHRSPAIPKSIWPRRPTRNHRAGAHLWLQADEQKLRDMGLIRGATGEVPSF